MLERAYIISYLMIFLGVLMSCKSQRTKITLKGDGAEIQTALNKQGYFRLSQKIYDLKGETLKIKGKLLFDGSAKIINGTLFGEQALIESPDQLCFENVTIKGTWKNKIGRMEWFTNGKDSRTNFLALTNLATIGGTILLNKIYRLITPPNSSFDTPNDLIIKGNQPDKCGFVLETKTQRGNAYFRTAHGNNIHFEKISISTDDYVKGRLPQGNDYVFASCAYSGLYPDAKPDLSFFRLENCMLNGAINFRYDASSKNTDFNTFKTLGVDEVKINGCTIKGAVTTLELSNVSYRQVNIENNTIRNLYGPVFFFPAGGIDIKHGMHVVAKGRPKAVIKNNWVKNDKVVAGISVGYMSLFVAKGVNFEVVNNTIENILNTKNGIETVPFYCSASKHLLVQNNKVRNVGSKGLGVGFGSNTLLKFKGALQCDVMNNEFIFDRKGMVALGLLSTENGDIRKVNPAHFRFAILGIDLLNRLEPTGYYNIRNNTFKAAMVSDHSFLCRTDVTLNQNVFDIEYLCVGDPNKWNDNNHVLDQTIFYLREAVKNARLIVKDNKVRIQKMDNDVVYFIRDVPDNKNYKEVVYENNVFEVDGIVSLAYPRAEKVICKNTLNGKGSFAYNDVAPVTPNRTVKRLDVVQQINEYRADAFPAYHIKNYGSAVIKTQNNTDSIVNIARLTFNDLYHYEGIDKFPLTILIKANLTDKQGHTTQLNYKLIIKDKSEFVFWDAKSGKVKTVLPIWEKQKPHFCYDIKSISKAPTNGINLSLVSQSRWKGQHLTGYLILRGLDQIKKFEISASVENLEIPRNKNADKLIRQLVSTNRGT